MKTSPIKLFLGILAYFAIATWLSSGLCYIFFGGNFMDAEPWAIFKFWQEFHDQKGERLPVFFATLIPYIPAIAFLLSDRWGLEELYGSARFARASDVKRAALFSKTGIIFGKLNGTFLTGDGTEHVFLAAPTRSGKGVGFVIPNLLTWRDSCIVLDMKFENYESTANYRKACGHEVFLFAPGQRNTHCFNPFDLIDKDDLTRIDMLQTIAAFICPTPKNADPMWSTEGRNLFIATALLLLDTNEYLTFNKILHFIQTNSTEDIENILIADHLHELDPVCRANFSTFLKMGDKQQGGVLTEITSNLTMFHNPLVAYATSKSDFNIRDLKKKRITIYLGATPKSLVNISQLFNLFFQFAIALNTEKLPDKDTEPYKILMLLDEFPALGEMELIKKGIGYFAGYGIRLAVIAQGESQIEDIYSNTGLRSFLTNFKYKIYYAPNDPKDAEALSAQLGTKTVKNISDSKPSVVSMGSGSHSESHSKASRSLMLAQEVRMLDRSKLILLVESMPPVKADKVVYYSDKFFKNKYYNLLDKDSTAHRKPPEVPEITLTRREPLQTENADTDDLGIDNDEPLSDDEMEAVVSAYFTQNVDIEPYEENAADDSSAYDPFASDDAVQDDDLESDRLVNMVINGTDTTNSDGEASNEDEAVASGGGSDGRSSNVSDYDPFGDDLENNSIAELLASVKDQDVFDVEGYSQQKNINDLDAERDI